MAVVEELGDVVSALQNAGPEHKLEVYAASGCTCRTTQKHKRCGQVLTLPRTVGVGFCWCPRGELNTNLQHPCSAWVLMP